MTPTRDETTAAGLNGTHPPAPEPFGGEVEVGTSEYDRLNSRRAGLIHQKYLGGGLTEAEAVELAHLQEVVGAAIDRRFPRTPFFSPEERAYVYGLLGIPLDPPAP